MTTANIITLIRLALIPLFVLFMELHSTVAQVLALCIFALASLTDHLDGHIARKYNQVTDLGKILDPLADKMLVFSAFVLFVTRGLMHPIALLLILAREFTILSIRIVIASSGKVVGAAFAGKLKTVLQIVAILCILFMPLPFMEPLISDAAYRLVSNILCWLCLIPAEMGGITAVTVWSGIEYCTNSLSLKNLKK